MYEFVVDFFRLLLTFHEQRQFSSFSTLFTSRNQKFMYLYNHKLLVTQVKNIIENLIYDHMLCVHFAHTKWIIYSSVFYYHVNFANESE